uniref:Hypotheticial protein n=1 Tax=Schistosoma japonicum TaxID=6182 RepID=C1LKF0_SCHJA|nr:hypotheticial protein [Schistosoma japonicum]
MWYSVCICYELIHLVVVLTTLLLVLLIFLL